MSSWWSGHRVVDPTDIENRYSTEMGMLYLETLGSEELSDEALAQLERVRAVLDQLPTREADFVDLYYFKKLKQTEIATIFAVSQPTVCYRLQRAALRIQFLLSLPVYTEDRIRSLVAPLLKDDIDTNIMVLMHRTTCQSEAAKVLNVTQGFVRHRYIRSLNKMRVAGPELEELVRVYDMISENLNILREVQRPTPEPKQIRNLL
jgi:predicted transcriptional regulator